jgi:hypothetical protein
MKVPIDSQGTPSGDDRFAGATRCTRCGSLLVITLQSVLESWEDEDKNRHYPVVCKSGRDECAPIIVRDGCTGELRELKTRSPNNSST